VADNSYPPRSEISKQFVVYSIIYAIANGIFEEVLWRGTYVVAFDGDLIWGYKLCITGWGVVLSVLP
jgi:membrane protease YdiL (CAAX protease family)